MTRINTVSPSLLTDQHLIAEYRELPRIFALARPLRPHEGARYTMGAGHVVFFYEKTGFLAARQAEIIAECTRRGFRIAHTEPPAPVAGLDGAWTPAAADHEVNAARLRDKLHGAPAGFYRYMGQPVGADFYDGLIPAVTR